jgi:hypothetical protein
MAENKTEIEKKLEEKLKHEGEKLPKWLPKEKDKMNCVFLGKQAGKGKQWKHLTFYSVEELRTKTQYSMLEDAVLRAKFEELNIKDGDIIALQFLGLVENKAGKIDRKTGEIMKYKNWKVVKV